MGNGSPAGRLPSWGLETDGFAADHLHQWTAAQLDRSREPARSAPIAPPGLPESIIADPWERAIARARAELREMIESGDLSHDEVTAGWIETWAADIYHDGQSIAA